MEVFLNDKYAQYLKKDLCVKFGFCSMGEKFEGVLLGQPIDISILVNEIFKAEGLNPEIADKSLLRGVRKQIIAVQKDFDSKNLG